MILGVVLGPIAEKWLSRSLAISTDVSMFFTQPWSLFFVIASVFSLLFTLYQRDRGKKPWTRFYPPALMLSLSVPLFMMEGVVRPVVAGGLIAFGLYLLYRAQKPQEVVES